MRKIIKAIRENKENIIGATKLILFMIMLALIFRVAPNIAYYIQNLEEETLTTAIEWLMIVAFSLLLLTPYFTKKENK